jgi:hypothetical protein
MFRIPPTEVLFAASMPEWLPPELLQAIIKCGPFAIGTLFGSILTMFIYKQSSKAMREREKIEREREKELLKQIRGQHERIDELHRALEKKLKA